MSVQGSKTLALAHRRAARLHRYLARTSLRWGDYARAAAHARRAERHLADAREAFDWRHRRVSDTRRTP